MRKKHLISIIIAGLAMVSLPGSPPAGRSRLLKPVTEFESGAAENVYERPDRSVAFSIPQEPGGPEYLWFNFMLAGGVVKGQEFVLENAADAHQTGSRWNITRPVFSADGKTWVRATEVDYSREFSLKQPLGKQIFHFKSPIAAETLRVAYCYPYTTRELDDFLVTVNDRLHGPVAVIGKSEEGRDIVSFQIGPHPSLVQAEPPEIWIICREHPGETPASFVLEGMVQGLLDSHAGHRLADHFAIRIVPLLNMDGIAHGYYYHNARGVNLSLDWVDMKSAEVRKLKSAMLPALDDKRLKVVVLLHSSNDPRLGHFFLEMPASQLYPPDALLQKSMLQSADANYPQMQGKSTIRLLDNSGITGNALYRKYGVYSLYLESNYSLGADGSPVTQQSLRETGKALVQALAEALAGE
jgi:hypothetical protein